MKLNLGISAMLVTAVLAGAAGGAVALSAATDPAPATQAPVTLHQVADETPSAPTPTVAPEAPEAPAPVEQPTPADPAPAVDAAEPEPDAETASEAANRAKAEADRAEAEADRAEDAATSTEPAAEPEPITPAPPKAPADCIDGKHGDVRESVTQNGTYTKECADGHWVVIKFVPKPKPTPEPKETTDPQPEDTVGVGADG